MGFVISEKQEIIAVISNLLRYSNGHIYSGHWYGGQRSGFGKLEETSMKGSFYIGGWRADKRNGYGLYEDRVK